MEHEEFKELIDAYAIGALEPEEARLLEEHLAQCDECPRELEDAREAAALLVLAAPQSLPSARLRARVLEQARREQKLEAAAAGGRRWWAIGGLAAASLALAVVAGFAFARINDLDADNDVLSIEITSAREVLAQQQQVINLSVQPDVKTVPMAAGQAQPQATGVYYYSEAKDWGMLSSGSLKRLDGDWVYHFWVLTPTQAVHAGDFNSWYGMAGYRFDFDELRLNARPVGVCVTAGAADDRTPPRVSDYVLYAPIG